MRTIAVINQKGGCGKTTSAINLAGVFASRGLRTLLVDVDPQSHCAAGLAIPEQRIDQDIGDAMLDPGGFDPARLLWRVSRNLDLAPSRMRLAGLEASRGGLADRQNKDGALRSVLDRLRGGYDACCIDCPPGIGLLTYNALAAADTVLIPVETSYFSLRGAAKQIDTIRSVARRIGVQTPYWLLATIHDEGSALARDLLAELRREFESRVCPVVVRSDAGLKEASSFGQTIVDYAPESSGAVDYRALAEWLLSQPSRTRGGEAAAHSPAYPPEPPVVHVPAGAGRVVLETLRPEARTESRPSDAAVARTEASNEPVRPESPAVSEGSPGGAEGAGAAPRPVPGGTGEGVGATEPMPTVSVIAEAERALTRTEDLVRRALLLQNRGGLAESPRPATVELVEEPEEALGDAAVGVPEAGGPIARLLGVRQTSRGALFVQPLSIGRSVAVAGDFNGWSPAGHEMRVNKGLGVFELLVPIPPGVYSYRLVVDGVWRPDPFNAATMPNPFGEPNSVLRIAAEPPRTTARPK